MSFIAKAALLAGLATVMAAGASAADLSGYEPAPAPAYEEPPAFKWGGAYVGAHGGIGAPKFNPFADGTGLNAGIQAGYNFQFGPGVVGAELEGSYLGNTEVQVPGGKLEERFRGAVKAKAGVSLDRMLLYGTAGLTMTKFESGKGVTGPDGWKQGYLLGGGVEHAFAGGLSARIEYNYVMTNDVTTSTVRGSSTTDLRDHVIKAGLNYRF